MQAQRILSKREFRKVSDNEDVNIIGATCFEKYSNKKHKKFRKLIHTNNKAYVIRNDLSGYTSKYIKVGAYDYIAVKKSFLIVLLPILIGVLLGVVVLFSKLTSDNEVYSPVIEGVDIDLSNPPMLGDQEAIDVPGLENTYILTSKNKSIKLINPNGNTVFFKYNIIVDNTVILKTDNILPNKMVVANLYDLLEAGIYDVTVHLETYDILTGVKTTPVNLSTQITIVK